MTFKCKRCGWCCKKPYVNSIVATNNDLIRWMKEGEKDILKTSKSWLMSPKKKIMVFIRGDLLEGEGITPKNLDSFVDGGELFFDEDGEKFDECPFLTKNGSEYFCKIHNTKPEICQKYSCDNDKNKVKITDMK